ncbi:MAG: hypothetical protein FD167_3852 [bacterium]|nr:MAG: hypothetical protein FD167_3852 [bacterium]
MSQNQQILSDLSNLATEIKSNFESFVAESPKITTTMHKSTQKLKDLNSIAGSLPKEVAISRMLEINTDEDNETKAVFGKLNQYLDMCEDLAAKWLVKYDELLKVSLLNKEDIDKIKALTGFLQVCGTILSLFVATLEAATNQISSKDSPQTPTIINVINLNRRFIKDCAAIVISFNDTAKELERLLSAQVSNKIN